MDEKTTAMIAGILSDLTDEQREKANACETLKELITLLGEMGVSLPDELMDRIAGGGQYEFIGSPVVNIPWLPPIIQ